ncbi:scarecrow transcription factor family protein [Striga asiatica]|uniref:Scarecrow transcription factor family protein n=1 Tax=Striga asiatica TaxID=4170 RepID=A0A5A7QK21_STRAF|nr:scarecrow transcription factor family protein [Striga asiatica]
MDPRCSEIPHPINGFEFDSEKSLPTYEQSQNSANGYERDLLELDVLDMSFLPLSPSPDSFAPSSTLSYETVSPDDQDSDPVLKFLNQILLEENMDEQPSMFHDPLALQAAEKSLYEVIGEKYPSSPYHNLNYGDQPLGNSDSSNAGSSSVDAQRLLDPGEHNSSQSLLGTVNSSKDIIDTQSLLQNFFTDSESILQFKRGMEEASKFLPTRNPLFIDLDKYELPQKSENITPPPPPAATKSEKEEDAEDSSKNNKGSKGRKHHYPEDGDSEGLERSSKQSVTYVDEIELSEMFDRVLLCTDPDEHHSGDVSSGGSAQTVKNSTNDDSVDLRTLLISCAQSVASDDRATAYEQLRQIGKHSSPTGDGYQRLAYVFATGLQARLAGTGAELYTSLTRRNITAAQKLEAYQLYLSICPFMKMSIFFANKMIAALSEKETTLHIIDFGILYGFQWPALIQQLSERPGGPPKLRITGIEIPQPGFRPAERVEETGVRLARSCQRFGVPFEYQAVASKNWETIRIEDLKIVSGEMLAVNCLFRFGRLLDETVVADSPRDEVLRLVRKMKPAIFVNAVTSGSYSAPFFVTRFREALFHYSALFDMFDASLPRDYPQRMVFEQGFYGPEVINVVACEGMERIERPETYKQWQFRLMRAGFKPFSLNPEIMEKLKHKKAMAKYHKDFLFGEDGHWMIQGWKGRILYASSCWVPSYHLLLSMSTPPWDDMKMHSYTRCCEVHLIKKFNEMRSASHLPPWHLFDVKWLYQMLLYWVLMDTLVQEAYDICSKSVSPDENHVVGCQKKAGHKEFCAVTNDYYSWVENSKTNGSTSHPQMKEAQPLLLLCETEGESLKEDDHSDAVFKFIRDMLMEEEDELQNRASMLHECLALQATEKSFYDVLNNNHNNSDHFTRNYSTPNDRSLNEKKKNRVREPIDEGHNLVRSNKQMAGNIEEDEPLEMFDSVLLCSISDNKFQRTKKKSPPNPIPIRGGRKKTTTNIIESGVDLRSLLLQCAQCVSAFDIRTANELLLRIREHSSPQGDGSQRLAHYLANAIDAHAVLELMRKMKPAIFVHGVVCGTYNTPFFVSRFKETLYHFSAMFDMFEATVAREDENRVLFEELVYGKEVMNVIACEDAERIERPEGYRQWQWRTARAGFRQMGLDKEIVKYVRDKVRRDYHEEFSVEEDGNWMLQGWKGRVTHAISCWEPANN